MKIPDLKLKFENNRLYLQDIDAPDMILSYPEKLPALFKSLSDRLTCIDDTDVRIKNMILKTKILKYTGVLIPDGNNKKCYAIYSIPDNDL